MPLVFRERNTNDSYALPSAVLSAKTLNTDKINIRSLMYN